LLTVALTLLGGCSAPHTPKKTVVTVFAAASLSEAFRAIEGVYEGQHPEIEIELNFAGSALLASQILEGAPADVFAAAHPSQLQRLRSVALAGPPRPLAVNSLIIAVPRHNPAKLKSASDLARPEVKIALAGKQVPAGRYGREALAALGLLDLVEANIVSNEHSVRGVVAKLLLGEVDAGIVYSTDLNTNDTLRALPTKLAVQAHYEVVLLRSSAHPQQAGEFVDFLLSGPGQSLLRHHGFSGADVL